MHRFALLLIALMIAVPAWAAPPETKPLPLEARIQMLEMELPRLHAEAAKQAKDEAEGIQKQLETKIEHNTKLVEVQNSHMDQVLSSVNMYITVGGIVVAAVSLLGGWKTVTLAKAEARDAAREAANLSAREEVRAMAEHARVSTEKMIKQLRSDMTQDLSALKAQANADLQSVRAGAEEQVSQIRAEYNEKIEGVFKAGKARLDRFMRRLEQSKHQTPLAMKPLNEAPFEEVKDVKLDTQVQEALDQGRFDEALRLLEELTVSKPDDPWVLIYISRANSALGHSVKARTAATRAHKIASERMARDPNDVEAARSLSACLDELGNLAKAEGNLVAARNSYQTAKDISEKVGKLDPDNDEWQRDLSVSWNNLGNVALAAGDLELAHSCFISSKEISERLHDRKPTDAERFRDVFVSFSKLGEVALIENRPADARMYFQKGREICEELFHDNRKSAQHQADLAEMDCALGDVASAEGVLIEARKCWTKGVQALEGLAMNGRLDAYGRELLERYRAKLETDFSGT